MKKYTEKQLHDSISSLREKMLVLEVEGSQSAPPELWSAMKAAGSKAADWVMGNAKPMFDPDQRSAAPPEKKQAPVAPVDTTQTKVAPVDTTQTKVAPVDTTQTKVAPVDATQPTVASVDATQSKVAPVSWPKTTAEIIAYQQAHGLVPDGKIGQLTLAKLKGENAPIPPGFVPVANRVHTAPQPAAAKQLGDNPRWAAADKVYQQQQAAADAKYNQEMDAINKQTKERHAAQATKLEPWMANAAQQRIPAMQESYSNSINELKSYMEILDESAAAAAVKAGKNVIAGLKGSKYPQQTVDAANKFQKITPSERGAHALGKGARDNAGTIAAGSALGGAAAAGSTLAGSGDDMDLTNSKRAQQRKPKDTTVYDNPIKPQPIAGGSIDPRTGDQFKMPQPANTTNDQWGNLPDQSAGADAQDQLDATNASRLGAPIAPTAQVPDPAIVKIQKDLIAKGYNLKPDGIMGPDTKRVLGYEKQFGSDYASKQNAEIELLKQPQPAKSPTLEHVSFSHDQDLARIIQLSGR
jgi:Putative peptidoglycan binding domain